MRTIFLFLLAGTPAASATPIAIFNSSFDGNTGAHVFATNTDNTSGSPGLAINDWTTHASVTAISGLGAISTGDGGTSGGFARTQGGTGTYANGDNVYLSRNHNLDSDRSTSRRGFSLSFTIDSTWPLTTLSILSGHTTNTGNQDQSYSSDLVFSLDGGTLGAPVTASSNQDYGTGPAYLPVSFDLAGTILGPGTYTLDVYQRNMAGGGAYATFDGITLEGDDGAAPPPVIDSFTANRTYVTPGSTVDLSWETTGAATLYIASSAGPDIGDVSSISTDGDGTIRAVVNEATTFTLEATNDSGTTTETISIESGNPRPNIVVFLVDDMGPHDTSVPFNLDPGGRPVAYNFNSFYVTPNMERLAASGMRFTNAYAQSVCSPTRCGIMTGRNSARHAVTDWVGGGGSGSPPNWRSAGLNASDITLPKLLKPGGYRTIHVGKAHFSVSSVPPQDLGFDVNIGGGRWGHPPSGYIGTAGYGGLPGLGAYDGSMFLTKALAIEANKAVEDAVDEGRPFFLHMSFYAVHAPFTTNPDASGDYSAATGGTHSAFATMIEGMDMAIGEIRRKLVDLGVAENTLIVFLGDNGSDSPATSQDGLPSGRFSDFPMRGKKGSKWEGGIRVPMLACWAAGNPANPWQQALPIPANSIETDIVSSWDLPVTLLGVAGLPGAAGFGEDGHDLRPYLAATPGSHRPQELVIHYPHNHRSDFFSLIRQGDMKLIYNYQTNSHQLYDLATDPTESNDLAGARPETVTRMARSLAQGLDATWGSPGVLRPTIATTAPNGNVVSIPDNPAVDVDADGLADTFEDDDLDGLVDPGETDPDMDNTDGDNILDGAELRLGTDPLDPSSYFHLQGAPQPDHSILLTWPSQPGVFFDISSSNDLDDWNTIATDVPAANPGATTSYPVPPTAAPDRFFRIGLK